MKTMSYFLKLFLPLGLMVVLFQGCYTQLVTTREVDTYYEQEQQPANQSGDNYYNEDNDNWRSHQYIGFSYYYPTWQSYWSWDYGCMYPSRWDPWYWGSIYYPSYGYYPHNWGYWNSYPNYNHWGYGSYSNNSHPNITRNSGYRRGGNSRENYGSARSGSDGTGTMYNGQVGTSRGGVNLPRAAGSVGTQSGNAGTTSTTRGTSNGVSTDRQSNTGRYNPSVQQPRYRDQSTTTTRSPRTSSSRDAGQSRNQGTNSGQSRSSERNSAPSYSPPPPTHSNPAPSSSPAPRNDSGGSRQSSGSGRSGR